MLSEFETIWLVKLTTKLLKKKFISDPQFEFWILLILKEKLLVENTEVQSKRSLHYSRVILRLVFKLRHFSFQKVENITFSRFLGIISLSRWRYIQPSKMKLVPEPNFESMSKPFTTEQTISACSIERILRKFFIGFQSE